MAYTKNTWVDQVGQVRYTETDDSGYKVLTANYDNVTELGTPVNATNMNHIEQGIYDNDSHIGVLSNLDTTVKTDLVSAINEGISGISNKADRDGANMVSSVKNFDGGWVKSTLLLSTSTAIGSYTLDLSSYLPNDNYNYEVKIVAYVYSNNNDESFYYFYNDLVDDVGNWGYTNVNARDFCNTFDFPISNQRSLTFQIKNTAADTVLITAVGYRRIGTNG